MHVRTIDCGFAARVAELLCVRNQSWLLCHRWLSYFACANDRGFVAADGRAALLARSIEGLVAADS